MPQYMPSHIKISCTAFTATIVVVLIFTAAVARAEPDSVIYECVNDSSGKTHKITPTPPTPPSPATACRNETLYTIEGSSGATGPTGNTSDRRDRPEC